MLRMLGENPLQRLRVVVQPPKTNAGQRQS
jgi:hypothetical protein